MTYKALIKLARLVSTDTLREISDGDPADRYVQRGGLQLLKAEGIPLIVDHDMSRRVGTVHGIVEFDDTDGPSCWARATVNDDAPAWIKIGTRCSYGSIPVHRSHHGWPHRGLVEKSHH